VRIVHIVNIQHNLNPNTKMTTIDQLPQINADETLSFNGVRDERYRFPVWSQMSRLHRVFFEQGSILETFSDRLGHIEVLVKALEHRNAHARCKVCGSGKPVGQSCLCFDNHSQ